MAATVHTAPSTLNYSLDPIWAIIQSDLIAVSPPFVDILIGSSGPVAGESFIISWQGVSITFTIASSDSENATGIRDMNGGESLDDYADAVAEYLRENEQITDDWTVTREADSGSDRVIRITFKAVERAELSVDDSAVSNITLTATDISGPAQVDNLRALVEVWQDTGDHETDIQLLKQHAPFDPDTALAWIDLSAAFADLEPDLPAASSINPAIPAYYGATTTRNYRKFYFRYAHKGGTPPQSDAMVKSGASYYAILGSKASDSLSGSTFYRVLHNYRRRDGITFRKPISQEQPDWVYWLSDNAGEAVKISILIYWSDGTTSAYEPYPASSLSPALNTCYKFGSGYRQMKLHLVTPSGGTDPEATIVGYDWRLEQIDAPGVYWVTVRYDVHPLPNHYGLYLLFSNGLGGCESVWLKGKVERAYMATRESFRRSRWPESLESAIPFVQTGDLGSFNAQGQRTYKCNTGWYSDPFYLEHLQQLPLADAWLIDLTNRRFVRVLVESKELIIDRDDETMYSMSIELRQATIDKASNY